ncbi:MAG: inorganic diphosphatase [Phycisphaeraceae bacterium]|nr:inorganic diphosphatase [Phycisphaeraceae bacterium]
MDDLNTYMKVPPGPDPPRTINAIVEIPKGRRSKFEIDKKFGLIRLDRYLYSSAMYPGDYGIVPQTLAEDGDPLDVLVMVNEPTFSGCLIEARPIGLFKMVDKGVNDYKILAVPNTDPIFAETRDLWRVPPHFLREVEHFFATYKQLEGDQVRTQGWHDADMAREEIMASIHRYLVTNPVDPVPEPGETEPVQEDKSASDERDEPVSFLGELD